MTGQDLPHGLVGQEAYNGSLNRGGIAKPVSRRGPGGQRPPPADITMPPSFDHLEPPERRMLARRIAAAPIFRDLDAAAIADLAADATFVSLARGELLMRQGDPSDALFVVARGALDVFQPGDAPDADPIEVLGEGACVGEMGTLTHKARSANVRARRAAMVVRVPAGAFERVLRRHAGVPLALARTLSDRLERTTRAIRRKPAVRVAALVQSCASARFAAFCERVRRSLDADGHRVALLRPDTGAGEARGEPGDEVRTGRWAEWISTAEEAHDTVLCACDADAPAWTRAALSCADLILVVGESGAIPAAVPAGVGEARAAGACVELVLLRRASEWPAATARWLEATGARAHHHVVFDDSRDYARFARHLSGRACGLVLGGGGARAFAHIGVLRALEKAGIPIDAIAGTSMGAILAALHATGRGPAEMLATVKKTYGAGGGLDLTLPFVALRSGRSTFRRLSSLFGERRLEDLPLTCFCMSCDLTHARAVVHDRGPVALWTRASCSIPGLLPPVAHEGAILVDGAFLENLPVSEMQRRVGGMVAASDVSLAADLTVSPTLASQPVWSGARQLARAIARRPRLPLVVDVLMRTAEVASVRDSREAGSPADLYLHVPLDGFTMRDFRAIDAIADAGYEYASRYLESETGAGVVRQLSR
ncbi:MAG TPA: patatin-like phospholipase family protein [Vicinamibacterales bacterium]|nr:patatin-like phospholipase family protein [Vicinamibacterales bacterium]